MVLITWATSEGSCEPAHARSLARPFAVRTHEVWSRRRVRPKIRHLAHWMAAHSRLKNEFTEDEKYLLSHEIAHLYSLAVKRYSCFSLVLYYTWCCPWCLSFFPVCYLGQDGVFDCIGSWSLLFHLFWISDVDNVNIKWQAHWRQVFSWRDIASTHLHGLNSL